MARTTASQPFFRQTGGMVSTHALDWRESSVRRLSFLCWAAFAATCFAALLIALREPNTGIRAGTERPLFIIPFGMLIALSGALLSRWKRIPVQLRLDFGLLVMVGLCTCTAIFRHWLPYGPHDVVRGTSPVAFTMMMFAAVIPVQPWRMAIAAIAATLLDGVTLFATVHLLDHPRPHNNLILWLLVPDTIGVVVSIIIARFLHTLGEQVKKAQEMGSYRLVEKLGQGGMGEVWRAEHRMLARPAAIKLVRPEKLGAKDEEAVARAMLRFEREARGTAGLGSPHTIEVYDFGTSDEGTFFYVMELLEGMDLETLVERSGPLAPDRAIFLMLQICHSLSDAHAQGLVHRDIKPANIFISRQGQEWDFVKVLDFGLVLFEAQEAEESRLTAEGSLLGSPAFMPPELAMGNQGDALTDIYALGCVAWWMLTGQLVFERNTPMLMLMAHVQDSPSGLNALSPHPISPAFEALIKRCLSKTPQGRPETIEAIIEALEALEGHNDWTQDHARVWWQAQTLDQPIKDSDPMMDTMKDPQPSALD